MNAPLDRQLAYLRLARTDQIGPVTFQRLLSVYGSPEKALAALPELSQRGGRKRPLKAFSMSKAKAEYGQTDALNGRYLFWGEAGYPAALQALPDAPPVLAAHGHTALLDKPMITMVGARNASAAVRKMTATLSTDLATASLPVCRSALLWLRPRDAPARSSRRVWRVSKAARFSPCQTRRLMRGVSARIIYCAMAR
ncbi:DNA-processing protein DprA [Alphaproteobacteria bacterium]|nr:DNA-processing protein DprA [Alphaproteobacteria bacterium]